MPAAVPRRLMPPSVPGEDGAEGGEEAGGTAERLADFGGDGVGGGLGEGGEDAGIEADGGAEAGDTEVCDDLGCAAAVTRLGEAAGLLDATPEAGGGEGEQEEKDQRPEGW